MIRPVRCINACLKAALALCLFSCVSAPGQTIAPPPGSEPSQGTTVSTPQTAAQPLPKGVFAIYEIITDPPGIGVFRETGNMVGITPVTLTLEWDYAFRITFMKKGYKLKGQFIQPTPGRHRLEYKMEREDPSDEESK